MRGVLLFLALLLTIPAAVGADYEREKKWADEILPGVVVGDPVWLEAQGRKFLGLYTEAGGQGGAALVLVHGIGVHPDWGLMGVLRTRLADAGYATLSVQMPVLAAGAKADAYEPTFAEAAARIEAAVRHLGGKAPVALVAHSLGALMANAYLSSRADPAAAYVAIGLAGPWPATLPAALPVLDIYGSADLPQVLEGARQRQAPKPGASRIRQASIPGADHFFAGAESQLVEAIVAFLRQAMTQR